ncbi:MAG: class I SAM-dependent DNA methyltransferase [Prevotella sp.]|nr:class I SAM-dependent DNA methyltransferase [Prevotella sp.]MBQ8702722.1 class I SAM-dependent DNA methyltransferase [Prevotella sp.]
MNRELQKIKTFVNKWRGKGREKQDTHPFWEELVEDLLGVKHGREVLNWEKDVPIPVVTTEDGKTTKYIDCYLEISKCIIEQKSHYISLDKVLEQSEGKPLNALEQAQRYFDRLNLQDKGRYTIACNFQEFRIKDNYHQDRQPVVLKLEDLPLHWRYLRRVLLGGEVENKDEIQNVTTKTASSIVSKLYELLKGQYTKKELTREVLHQMNVFCVRVVFCLYADAAELFDNNQFNTFLNTFDAKKMQEKFRWLFRALDQHESKREESLDVEIKAFPQVNGGLFGGEEVPIPRISEDIRKLLLSSSEGIAIPGRDEEPFDWSQISPTNFGCIFESTLDPDTRHDNGMHYTSPEVIHRVIDPLFLNDLKKECNELLALPKITKAQQKERNEKLLAFKTKLSQQRFLDPACGSGNFLTETFKSLRRLEMEIITELPDYGFEKDEIRKGVTYFRNPCTVSINQFYGIEINDFACEVAKTAMWISDCQMDAEIEELLNLPIKSLPLDKYSNIHRKDALITDWNDVIPAKKLCYIIGNPPFEGSQVMDERQKESLRTAMSAKDKNGKNIWQKQGKMDFVCAWYAKVAEYLKEQSKVKTALVSTNSITQGELVGLLWKPLVEKYNAHISFAWKSFVWNNDAEDQAKVHCVIIGFYFSKRKKGKSYLYLENKKEPLEYERINAYLLPAEQLFIAAPKKHIQGDSVSKMRFGSMPNDTVVIEDESAPNGKRQVGLLRISSNERKALIENYPELEVYLPRIFGSEDFINGEKNYCIWIDDDAPDSIRNHEALRERFNLVKVKRANSSREETKLLADYPYKFGEIRQPSADYLLVPRTSSENRNYIPMGYVSKDIICSDACMTIESCPKWVFGVLESRLHMAWIKVVCGRLKSDYRYSIGVVYNNFPWPKLNSEQINVLEITANKLLQARDKELVDKSYETIYDSEYIPSAELAKALRENNKEVFKAYASFGISQEMSDEDIALALLRKSVKIASAKPKKRNKKRAKRKKSS